MGNSTCATNADHAVQCQQPAHPHLTAFQIGWLSKTNSSLVPPHCAFNTGLQEREYNTQKAKELFGEAGIKDGLELNYNTIAGRAGWRIQGEMLQQSLAECGIKLNIVASDLAQWASLRTPGKHYQGWINPNGNERAWDPSQQLKGYTSNETISKVYYANPEVDALLEKGRATCHQSERVAVYHRMQEILAEDQPYIFLYYNDSLLAVSSRVRGIKPAPAGIDYNFIDWFVPKSLQRYSSG